MKRFFILLQCLAFSILSCYGQKISTEKWEASGGKYSGSSGKIEATLDLVNPQWNKYLKTLGKTRTSAEGTLITTPEGQVILGVLIREGENTRVALGVSDSSKTDHQKLIREFIVTYYRYVAQQDLDAALRAQLAVEKVQTKLQSESKNLELKLADNQREKVQLEKALVTNATEFQTLTSKISKNKSAQDSLVTSLEQVKKAVELKKAALGKIN